MEEQIFLEIKKYIITLKNEQRKLRKKIEAAPTGQLYSRKNKGKYSQLYYKPIYSENNNGKERYLSKGDLELKKRLAQRDYDIEMLKHISEYLEMFELLPGISLINKSQEVFSSLPKERKILVNPFFEDDKIFIDDWYKKNPGAQNNYEFNYCFETSNGVRVRSKSEYMLAVLFEKMGIPFVYEPRLKLTQKTIYPDFALLCLKNRKTYYYEHFGMMGDSNYSTEVAKKLLLYQNNGFYFGENMLFSMETADSPLDIKQVENMLAHFLL